MLHWLQTAFNTYVLHAEHGNGYQWHSGIGSDWGEYTVAAAAITMVLGFWHQHNCHVHRCPRLKWHVHPDHGHPVCKKHHPHDPKDL